MGEAQRIHRMAEAARQASIARARAAVAAREAGEASDDPCAECRIAPDDLHQWCAPWCVSQTHPRPCEPLAIGKHVHSWVPDWAPDRTITTTTIVKVHTAHAVEVEQFDGDQENWAGWTACAECGLILESGSPHRPPCSQWRPR